MKLRPCIVFFKLNFQKTLEENLDEKVNKHRLNQPCPTSAEGALYKPINQFGVPFFKDTSGSVSNKLLFVHIFETFPFVEKRVKKKLYSRSNKINV